MNINQGNSKVEDRFGFLNKFRETIVKFKNI